MTSGDRNRANAFLNQAWKADSKIFLRDPRSLLTLCAVKLSPLAQILITRSLSPATK